jgi:protein tyrosine/serine phosphatase
MYQKKPFSSKKKNPVLYGMDYAMYVIKSARGPMESRWQRYLAHFESLFVDDGFLSVLFPNRHRISEKMWRSSQPYYWQIGGLAEKGIKTIINLRGKRDCASYLLEEAACRRHGIKLVDFPVNSRQPPKLEILEQIEGLFASIEYPALMHCKAGSDRAGIMSALYLIVAEKVPVKKAKKQLSLRFGHVRQSKTGVLDKFLEEFERFSSDGKTDFMTWARTAYDRDAVIKSHKTFSWAEWLYNKALKRE